MGTIAGGITFVGLTLYLSHYRNRSADAGSVEPDSTAPTPESARVASS